MQFHDESDEEYHDEVQEVMKNETNEIPRFCYWYRRDEDVKKAAVDEDDQQELDFYNLDSTFSDLYETRDWKKALEAITLLKETFKKISKIRNNDEETEISMQEFDEKVQKVQEIAQNVIDSIESMAEQTARYDTDFTHTKKEVEEAKETLNSKAFLRFKNGISELSRLKDLAATADEEDDNQKKDEDTELEVMKSLVKAGTNAKPFIYSEIRTDLKKMSKSAPRVIQYVNYELFNALVRSCVNDKCMSVKMILEALSVLNDVMHDNKIYAIRTDTFKEVVERAEEALKKKSDDKEKAELQRAQELLKMEGTIPILDTHWYAKCVVRLLQEVHRLCQNTTTNYVTCLDCESRVLKLAMKYIQFSRLFKSSIFVAEEVLKAICNRSFEVDEILSERYGRTIIPVDKLWEMVFKGSHDCREVFLIYCFYVAQRDVKKVYDMLMSELTNELFGVFTNKGQTSATSMVIPEQTPVEVKIAYNRLVAQMAISMFRCGELDNASEILKTLFVAKNLAVIIGQQIPRIPFTKNEERALHTACFTHISVAPHCNLNTQLLETIYFLCCSVEHPLQKLKGYTKSVDEEETPFERFLKQNTKNVVAGPATTDKEHIASLYIAIESADASAAIKHLSALKLWSQGYADAKHNVASRIREACLKVFLYTEAIEFENITINYMNQRFSLETPALRRVINEAVLERDSPLIAFWNETEDAIAFERGSLSSLHRVVSEATREIIALNPPQHYDNNDRRWFHKAWNHERRN